MLDDKTVKFIQENIPNKEDQILKLNEEDIQTRLSSPHWEKKTQNDLGMKYYSSVEKTEKTLGIKITVPPYIYPDNMTAKEFHASIVGDVNRLITAYDQVYGHNINSPIQDVATAAHLLSHKEEHFGQLETTFKKLQELNPQLKSIDVSNDGSRKLADTLYGVSFKFPVADIKMFNEQSSSDFIEAGNLDKKAQMCKQITGKNYYRNKIFNSSFMSWRISPETWQSIDQGMQEKKAKSLTSKIKGFFSKKEKTPSNTEQVENSSPEKTAPLKPNPSKKNNRFAFLRGLQKIAPKKAKRTELNPQLKKRAQTISK